MLNETAESDMLAAAYHRHGALPATSCADARHLAVATLYGVDAVVSWNFRHMVNIFRKRRVLAVNVRYGKALLEIVAPTEIAGAEEDPDDER